MTDAKSQTTEYGYDAQSRIETIAYADGKTVTLSYDADGNLSGYSDGTTSATYTYDDMGRKLTETVNYGSFSKSFSYTYYGNGLKQTFTAPDGTVYTYNYGLNNELQEVQIPGVGDITIPAYTWNRPATVNFPGGTQRTYGYDALMRLQSLTVAMGAEYTMIRKWDRFRYENQAITFSAESDPIYNWLVRLLAPNLRILCLFLRSAHVHGNKQFLTGITYF